MKYWRPTVSIMMIKFDQNYKSGSEKDGKKKRKYYDDDNKVGVIEIWYFVCKRMRCAITMRWEIATLTEWLAGRQAKGRRWIEIATENQMLSHKEKSTFVLSFFMAFWRVSLMLFICSAIIFHYPCSAVIHSTSVFDDIRLNRLQ